MERQKIYIVEVLDMFNEKHTHGYYSTLELAEQACEWIQSQIDDHYASDNPDLCYYQSQPDIITIELDAC